MSDEYKKALSTTMALISSVLPEASALNTLQFSALFDVDDITKEAKPPIPVWYVAGSNVERLPLLYRVPASSDTTIDHGTLYKTEAEGNLALQAALIAHLKTVVAALQIVNKHVDNDKEKKAGQNDHE